MLGANRLQQRINRTLLILLIAFVVVTGVWSAREGILDAKLAVELLELGADALSKLIEQ